MRRETTFGTKQVGDLKLQKRRWQSFFHLAWRSHMTPDRLELLLAAAVEGRLTTQDREELSSALIADPELRHFAAGWLFEESLLRREAASLFPAADQQERFGSEGLEGEATPARRLPRRSTSSFLVLGIGGLALACTLLLNAMLWLQEPAVIVKSGSGDQSSRDARLVEVTGCVWDASPFGSLERGSFLPRGETLKLLQGIAEIDVRDQHVEATVRLMGPCKAEMRSGDVPNLLTGRMVANIRVYGGSVRTQTPLGILELKDDVILGIVKQGSVCSVHVLDGVAECITGDDASWHWALGSAYIHKGEAISSKVDASGAVEVNRVPADVNLFAEERSMASSRLEVGDDYARAVIASRPASYWRFGQSPGEVLVNEISDGIELRVGGEVSSVTYGSNSVLEFGMTRRAGYLYSDNRWPAAPLGDFSAELWVKPSHYHNGSVLGFTAESDAAVGRSAPPGYAPHAVLLELGGTQQHWRSRTPLTSLRYLLRDEPSGDPEGESGSSVINGYEVRRWQHLVYVKRGDRLELFRDGERIASDPCEGKKVAEGLQLCCGRLYPNGDERLFVGQMDELAIYEHALSEAEILRHFSQGIPKEEPPDSI